MWFLPKGVIYKERRTNNCSLRYAKNVISQKQGTMSCKMLNHGGIICIHYTGGKRLIIVPQKLVPKHHALV